MIEVYALKSFSSPVLGNVQVTPGYAPPRYTVDAQLAANLHGAGLVEYVKKSESPTGEGGQVKLSQSSQAGQASHESKPNTLGGGAAPLSLTTTTSNATGPTPSTPAIQTGGSDTETTFPKASQSTAKKSGSRSSTARKKSK